MEQNKKLSKIHFSVMLPLALLALLFSCSSDKEEINNDTELQLPVLGTCASVTPLNNLTIENGTNGPIFHYNSHNGGTIDISLSNGIIIKHQDYPNLTLEFWGDLYVNGVRKTSANHENLNGKHIKDRFGSRRTIIFPDGTKITFVAKDEYEELLFVSIYDGPEVHHINALCGKVEYSNSNFEIATAMDNLEADGETGTFEITATGLMYSNIYVEDVAGNKVANVYPLGSLSRDNPNQVNDYFDDPRLGHSKLGH